MKIRLTPVKNAINKLLKPFNLKFDTLTTMNIELKRLNALSSKGHFDKPVFLIPESFKSSKHNEILDELSNYKKRFRDFSDPDKNDVGYTFNNMYFTSSDAEVLYTIIRKYKPNKLVEIGSGNSSLIARQAIIDGNLKTKFISIDPYPRIGIDNVVDRSIRSKVEDLDASFFDDFRPNDILFIDSSHVIKAGNDVIFLFLEVIPQLPEGAIIHVHDIFLPYEYPRDWVIRKIENLGNLDEQYLLQSILSYSDKFEVLWPGYYLQKTYEKFSDYFPNITDNTAKSIWLRKKKG